jgi:uncharacterized protein (DUF362 family)/Pyruvate/2-oxoacid:ferredoxin oxidoreductase delta subunit
MSPRPVVSISRCEAYEPSVIASALDESLRPLGGMQAFVRPGQSVFLKVNLLSKAEPARMVTTHPELVRAVVRAVKAAGGEVSLGDSPGGRNSAAAAARLFEVTGMTEVAESEGARLVLLDDDPVRVPVPDRGKYASLTLGGAAVNADVLITLPKFKTHGFMTLTGAVKNQFGLIPGLEKAQFHLKVPSRPDFADMLIDINEACRPNLAIMDAVVGMEGEGPAGGSPKPIGALIASTDVYALDVVMAAMAGLAVGGAPVTKQAAARGLGPAHVDEVEMAGAPWRDVAPAEYVLPQRDLSSRMSPAMAERAKGLVTAKPYLAEPARCTSCATCAQNCPAEAITMKDGKPTFDYGECIRCYCCQELCPPQVIALKRNWLVRALVG